MVRCGVVFWTEWSWQDIWERNERGTNEQQTSSKPYRIPLQPAPTYPSTYTYSTIYNKDLFHLPSPHLPSPSLPLPPRHDGVRGRDIDRSPSVVGADFKRTLTRTAGKAARSEALCAGAGAGAGAGPSIDCSMDGWEGPC